MEKTLTCKNCFMPMTKPEDFGTNKDGSPNHEYCVYCMKDGAVMKFCQSCSMPLSKPEDHGTNRDGSPSEDYCTYCFKDGVFVSDLTMDEMIQICVKYSEESGQGFGEGITKEQAVVMMKEFFPTLKRWKQA